MSFNVPISNDDTDYQFFINIDDVRYLFQFRYNYRSGVWMLNILDSTSVPIYMGITLHVFQDLLTQIRSYPVPQKLFVCMNNASIKVEPTRDSFSKDVVLLYDALEA